MSGVDSLAVASSKSRLPASKSRLLAQDRGSRPSTKSRIATAVRGPLAFGLVAWSEVPDAEVRVLTTFGAIPPDVIAARSGLPEAQRDAVRDALRANCMDAEGKRLFRDVFGGETFVEDATKSYESLARALDMASVRGLFG